MEIARAGAGDAHDVAALAADTFPLACPPGESPAQIAKHVATELTSSRFAEHLSRPTRTVLVARDGEQLIGYAMLIAEPPVDAEVAAVVHHLPTVELSKCYVRAEHHGTGVADALMEAAAAHATSLGARSMWLGVSDVNPRAIGFYERSGFVRIGARDFWLGTICYRDPVMERVLPAQQG